jgi:hemin uptake protein HemP
VTSEVRDATTEYAEGATGAVPVWEVTRLTDGGREALIRHEGQLYRLRITVNRKLILTK